MARPTDYTPELLEKARQYLDCYAELGEVIPTVEGLAVYLDIARSTIYAWYGQEDKQEFSDIVEKTLAGQAKELANKGLSGDFNPTITKLMMTKHGYSDRQEITGKDGAPLIPERQQEIDRAIESVL